MFNETWLMIFRILMLILGTLTAEAQRDIMEREASKKGGKK